jgi:hypothetical protein
MTKVERKQLKKYGSCVGQKVAVRKSKSPLYFSTDLLLCTATARIFLIAGVELLA